MKVTDVREAIVSMHDSVYQFALFYTRNRETARDLTQETFLKALTNCDKYQNDTNLAGWLRVIVKHTFINGYRRRVLNPVFYEGDMTSSDLHLPEFITGENLLEEKGIREAIAGLDKLHRTPFQKHLEGFKYEEIAGELRLPVGTVKSRIFKARKLVAQQIEESAS